MSYGIEWSGGPVVIGAALLLLLVPGFALIAVAVIALAVVAALGALLASPYLLVRTLRRRNAATAASIPDAPPSAATLTALPG